MNMFHLIFNKKSLFFKVAVILFAAGLLELMLFFTWEDTVASLKGDASAINMVGSERMRLLKIALLAEHYAEGVEQDSGTKVRAKVMLNNEMDVFENILFGLRDGNPRYNLKKEDAPEIIAILNQTIDKWNKTVKPMFQNILFAPTDKTFAKALENYRQEVFAYVNSINELVALFERHSEEKVDKLRRLQFIFLFLSGLIAAGSLIFAYTVIIKPIRRLNRALKAMASGDIYQTVSVLSHDEIGELGESFNDMTIQLRTHMDSMGNMMAQLRGHIDALDEKIVEVNKQKRKYEGLVNNLNVAVLRRAENGSIVEANDRAVAMFEAGSKEELLTRNVIDFCNDENKLNEISERILKCGFIKDEEMELSTLRGRKFLASLNSAATKDDKGNLYFDCVIEDISVRKKLEEQVRHSQKMEAVGELAAGVAHEINNPLASMAVCVESLMRRLQSDSFRAKNDYERFYNYLKIIEDEIYRSKNITVGLLDFSRKMGLITKSVNINKLLTEAIKLIQLQQKYHIFIVRTDMEEDLPEIVADEGQVRQVFLALIKNAFEAMRPGGLLQIKTLSAMKGENRVVKAVFKDNGCGISKENIGRIFEAFFSTKGHNGTGLGLSVCYGIVSQHGGRIDVESEEGVGSAFTVTLPCSGQIKNSAESKCYYNNATSEFMCSENTSAAEGNFLKED